MRPLLRQGPWRPLLRALPPRGSSRQSRRNLLTLAIETSCDDTCVAILSKDAASGRATLHYNEKSTSDNRAYGGVYPPVALRGHDAALAPLVAESLSSLPPAAANTKPSKKITVADVARQKPDFVTVTRGPGMAANLATGLAMAKGLATAWQVPLLGVNHMQAHALTPRLVSALDGGRAEAGKHPEFPFMTLLVSGGHTQLVHSSSLTDHRILVASNNIAVGDALDKAARHILPADVIASAQNVMFGALLERFAFPGAFASDAPEDYDYEYNPPVRRGDEITAYIPPEPYTWTLTPPLALSRTLAYDFNGLGSEVRKVAKNKGVPMSTEESRVLARATMRLLFEHLASRMFLALEAEPEIKSTFKTLVVSGGVASNRFLMHILRKILDVRGFEHVEITAPPPALCTDNAAMIAWTGMEMYEAGWESELSVSPHRKWSVDPAGEEGGILGVGGWVRRSKRQS
ncbi:glycoprotease [Colletotrichum sojae]|uniref:N(6)-L-threonylcarbamoyladenine synthase n=1 Tax=Colletotrichum sojae TaxID=2175907 RepID=A0A8H6MYX6_9PEZI|nr:glycoprotease [Colletotrichum sojae]